MDNEYPEDFPDGLRELLEAVAYAIGALFAILMLERMSVQEWQREMEALLARYHTAAYMSGLGSPDLKPEDMVILENFYAGQLTYLDDFVSEMLVSGLIGAGLSIYLARAQMYGGAMTAMYWQGNTKGLTLPAYPGDGSSECLSNDHCMWEIKTLNKTNGDYDAFWRLDDTIIDHCQTCLDRSKTWNPLMIRGGFYASPV